MMSLVMMCIVICESCLMAQRAPSSDKYWITIGMEDITCTQTTQHDERDEIYLLAKVPGKSDITRYPVNKDGNDDYYELKSGWSTAGRGWTGRGEDPRTPPRFWEGCLKEGESATIVIQVREQDNVEWNRFRNFFDDASEEVKKLDEDQDDSETSGGGDVQISAAGYPTEHASLGTFAVTVHVISGQPVINWFAVDACKKSQVSGDGSSFVATVISAGAQESQYSFRARVTAEARIPKRERVVDYLGDEKDGCSSEAAVAVEASTGWFPIPPDAQEASFSVSVDAEGYWHWKCGESENRSRGRKEFRDKVNYIKMRREGADIYWACYNLHWTEIPAECK